MRILFSVRNPWYVRHYDSVLRRLAARGHQVDLVADGLGKRPVWPPSVEALARDHATIRLHWTPPLAGQTWYEFGTRLRQALYFLRFLQPEYEGMSMLLARTEVKAPPLVVRLARMPLLRNRRGLRLLQGALGLLERAVPPSPEIAAFLRGLRPDVVVVTPLIILRTVQLDLVRCARVAGIPTIFGVASWDHLSSKGLLHEVPDRVLVWNPIQREEAIARHGVPPDRVRMTGAQLFDDWFTPRSTRTREDFCRRLGIDPARPYVLYVVSALFENSPSEVEFAASWIRALRSAPQAAVREASIVIRPHPRRAEQWEAADLSPYSRVIVYPHGGAAPVDDASRDDYYDSMRFASAVVGINTSAMIEAAILERPVLTVLHRDFRENQEGTVHFRYLIEGNGSLVETSRDFDEHTRQLDAVLRASSTGSPRSAQFVNTFIRPLGRDMEATGRFVEEVESLAGAPQPWIGQSRPPLAWLRLLLYPLARMTATAAVARRNQLRSGRRSAHRHAVDRPSQTE